MSPLSLSDVRITVVGDAMLDRYVIGTADRISPEAPVPVVLQRAVHQVPGGAANVAANIATLGGTVYLVAIVGKDGEAADLSTALNDIQVLHSFLPYLSYTVLKTRIMADRQQLVRIDREQTDFILGEEEQDQLVATSVRAMDQASVLVLSDYAKGTLNPQVCARLIAHARGSGIRTIVDPKHADWSRYRGADLITPNLKELGEASGSPVSNEDDKVVEAARVLMARHRVGAVLVTRSDKGMSYISDSEVVHSPAKAREVYDVTGAGDTVLAMVAVLSSGQMTWAERLAIANVAAGIAVGHSGTARVSVEEVAQTIGKKPPVHSILDWDALSAQVQLARASGRTVVFTNGCFDVLHRGHVQLLEQAASMGDILIVGLNSDDSVQRIKGPSRPINSLIDRASVLSSLSAVTFVTAFDEDTPERLIGMIRPDVLVKGGDYQPNQIVGREHAGRTVTVPLVEGHSSTRIIKQRGTL